MRSEERFGQSELGGQVGALMDALKLGVFRCRVVAEMRDVRELFVIDAIDNDVMSTTTALSKGDVIGIGGVFKTLNKIEETETVQKSRETNGPEWPVGDAVHNPEDGYVGGLGEGSIVRHGDDVTDADRGSRRGRLVEAEMGREESEDFSEAQGS